CGAPRPVRDAGMAGDAVEVDEARPLAGGQRARRRVDHDEDLAAVDRHLHHRRGAAVRAVVHPAREVGLRMLGADADRPAFAGVPAHAGADDLLAAVQQRGRAQGRIVDEGVHQVLLPACPPVDEGGERAGDLDLDGGLGLVAAARCQLRHLRGQDALLLGAVCRDADEDPVEQAEPLDAIAQIEPPRVGAVLPPDVSRLEAGDPDHLGTGVQIGAGAAEHGGGDVGTAGGAVVEDVADVGDVPDGQNRRDADGPQMVLGLRELPLQTILAGLRAVLRTSGGGILVELRAGGPGVQNRQDPKHLSQRLNRQAVLAAHDLPQADGAERGAMIRHSGSALTALLTLLVLWAPLPFASATPWAVAIIQVCCFTALALAAAALRDGGRLRPALLPAAALAAVALLAFLQSLPWPGFVVSLLSPQHAAAAARAAALPEVSVAHRFLSLAPGASQAAALQWAALAAALLAGAAAGWRAARRWIAGAVILGGIFQAFFGAYAQYKRALTLW